MTSDVENRSHSRSPKTRTARSTDPTSVLLRQPFLGNTEDLGSEAVDTDIGMNRTETARRAVITAMPIDVETESEVTNEEVEEKTGMNGERKI